MNRLNQSIERLHSLTVTQNRGRRMAETLRGGQSPANETDKMVTLIHGQPGAGKTALGLSWPSPIWFFNCDRPAKTLIERLPEHYEVHYESASFDVDNLAHGMAAQFIMKFDKLLKEAMAAGGTLFIDGWDLFWEMVKTAKVPGLTDDTLPKEYQPANNYMFNLARRLINSKLEVVLSTISEKPWSGATKQADYYVSSGWKHKDRFITTEVYCFTPEDRRRAMETPLEHQLGQSHSAYIGMNKLNESTVGSVVPNLSYKMLYRMTFKKLPENADKLWVPSGVA